MVCVFSPVVEEFQSESCQNTLYLVALHLQTPLIVWEVGSRKTAYSAWVCTPWPTANINLKYFSSVQGCYFTAVYGHPAMLLFWWPFLYLKDFAPAEVSNVVRHPFNSTPEVLIWKSYGVGKVWCSGCSFWSHPWPDVLTMQGKLLFRFFPTHLVILPPYALTVVSEKQLNYTAPRCECMLLSHTVGNPEKLMSGGKMMRDKGRGKTVQIIKRNWGVREEHTKGNRKRR